MLESFDFQKSTSGPFKVLGDSLRKQPDHLFKTIQESNKLLATHKTAYPGVCVLILDIAE